jgi:hypothetical protein
VGTKGQREREREREREKREREWARGKRTLPTARPHRAAREREGERTRVCADRRGPPIRHRGRASVGARGGGGARLSGPFYAEIGFPFSRDFLIAFLFNFSRVFNSNSNQVSNSNQIKSMQQFKENLGSI